jgi:hypothetical protein
MFKQLYARKKRQDLRFVQYEDYHDTRHTKGRAQQVSDQAITLDAGFSNVDSLKAGMTWRSKSDTSFGESPDSVIYVQENHSENEAKFVKKASILKGSELIERAEVAKKERFINKPAILKSVIEKAHQKSYLKRESDFLFLAGEQSQRVKLPSKKINKPSAILSNSCLKNRKLTKSLGIFSDTKMYSALIRSELQSYQLNVKHFNHPKTFVKRKYPLFDSVSAWIVFLSDDCDSEFLDTFVDRYYEKPTLFLCPKTSRAKTSEKIEAFIADGKLES